MRFVFFYHSLISDWSHGDAHFLRGVATELGLRGHSVTTYEPRGGWSAMSLVREQGWAPIREFRRAYPELESRRYEAAKLDLGAALEGADVAIVHERNEPELVRRIGEYRARHPGFLLLFHDTDPRGVTDAGGVAGIDLRQYDAVLAFGRSIRDRYVERGWARRAFTWHEAADTRVFKPISGMRKAGDIVWIGNWGDEERADALREFLLEPVQTLGLRAKVYGVRYPAAALRELEHAGIAYGGWLPNFRVPEVLAQYRVTLHVPRRSHVEYVPGIPTIRVFEALACGIPLVCAAWEDTEGLFTEGHDYISAQDGPEMTETLRELLADRERRRAFARHGRSTILRRHTCAHRVDELLRICHELRGLPPPQPKMGARRRRQRAMAGGGA